MAALQDTKPENLPESIRHYINGEWVDSVDGTRSTCSTP